MGFARFWRSGRLGRLSIAALAAGVALPVAADIGARAAYAAPNHTFAVPSPGQPSTFAWNGVTLQSPPNGSSASAVPSNASPATCPAPDSGNNAICEDGTLTVPAVSPATLYVKVGWHHQVWKAYLYLTSPDGTVYGGPRADAGKAGGPTTPPTGATRCDETTYQKGCGNETNLAFDEVTVPSPAAGVWKFRVSAVTIHNESYTGLASLTNSNPVQYLKENLAQLTSHLTRNQRVNVVFAGWKPTAAELAVIKANLPDQYQPSVAGKRDPLSDCGDLRDDGQGTGLVQHHTCHFTGTDSGNSNVATSPAPNPNNPTFAVPYFEPLKFNFDYHFLAADDNYTKDLFAVAKAHTLQDQGFGPTTAHAYLQPLPVDSKAAYLQAYNAKYGALRGTDHLVADASKVDMVDAFAVEDWMQNTRLDPKYCKSFTDLSSGAVSGAQFINPDPNAQRDPYWDGNGTRAVQIDRDPQGTNQGVSFFLFDTFSPSYAKDYFRPDHYHTLSSRFMSASGVDDHIKDPDSNVMDGVLDGRGWGGRYRFYFQDLGAAPSPYERAQWARFVTDFTAVADEGSAGFDPPIWQYRNDPHWNGTLPGIPTAAGGSTLGQVLGWDINQGIAYKYIGSFLYRPYPSDVYVVAQNTWIDHYSQPSAGDLYAVIPSKLYQPAVALKALNSAAPYATFNSGTSQLATLGCAKNRNTLTVSPGPIGIPISTPGTDATCSTEDPRQVALEASKSTGSGALINVAGQLVPDFAINPSRLQDFIDQNRPTYAPLFDGAFTIPVLNLMLEKFYSMAIPGLASGIAAPSLDGDGWGTINTRNDARVLKDAIDCSQSAAGAPGCGNTPDIFPHDSALTYVAEHEAAHFLGLHHPHDGTASVEKASQGPTANYSNSGSPLDGAWRYYYWMLKWQYDYTASPTTYGHTYGVYETVDQQRLMYGHTAEYMNQAQDWIADAYFNDGASGLTAPSSTTTKRQNAMIADRNLASQLFQKGDYLHAQYAMKNASLHAKGVTQKPVQPHQLSLAEAAHDQNAVFAIKPQASFDPNRSVCAGGGGGGGGGCSEGDGTGHVSGKNGGQSSFNADGDECEDLVGGADQDDPAGSDNHVEAKDDSAAMDFHSTQVVASTVDPAAHTMTITGVGVNNGVPVAFTAAIVDNGSLALDTFSLVLSDGYANNGHLLDGVLQLG
jgi:hypothetical protein